MAEHNNDIPFIDKNGNLKIDITIPDVDSSPQIIDGGLSGRDAKAFLDGFNDAKSIDKNLLQKFRQSLCDSTANVPRPPIYCGGKDLADKGYGR